MEDSPPQPDPATPAVAPRPPLLGRPGKPGWRGELPVLLFYLLATVVLTWPIAITLLLEAGLFMAGDGTSLAEFCSRHRRLVVLTGAGCSTASGIPE